MGVRIQDESRYVETVGISKFKLLTTSMSIKIPETALALAKSRKSERVMNFPWFLFAGFLAKPLFGSGLVS